MPLVVVLSSGQFGKPAWWVIGFGVVVPTLILELGYSEGPTNAEFHTHLMLASQLLKMVLFAMFGYFYLRLRRLAVVETDMTGMSKRV